MYTSLNLFLLRYLLAFWLSNTAGLTHEGEVKILALGNSITQGNQEHPSYRYRLWQKLADAGADVAFVGSENMNFSGQPAAYGTSYKGRTYTNCHEGHWGWTADEILQGRRWHGNLARWLQSYTPDIVLLHLGSNDMLRQCGSGNTCYQETIEELRQIITLIREKNPHATVLLAQLTPVDEERFGPAVADHIVQLNKHIPALAQEMSTAASPVILVDQFSGFNPATGADTWDGIHPNARGEEKMAQRWFDALMPLLRKIPVEHAATR
ncbi:SGNH/GDSL hydrolase family protein [Pontibacter mangrovi]|uniref:Cellulose-binding protein n=1 Tax=Pontibacter mangrovi TaxID=2589816 RepID=A0A501WAR1_9BACT|nr:SGNH/GDSL hydrolase family protein [Pontibacter mangrovi]TPE43897.1 cellulose-binding protein [Pontibacter mangrovi]